MNNFDAAVDRMKHRVADQMKRVQSGELPLHIAAGMLGLMPEEMNVIYARMEAKDGEEISKSHG